MESKEVIRFLDSIQRKKILVKSSGYISCQTVIHELEYIIKYEIATIKDRQTENFMVIDLRKIKEVKLDEKGINILIFIDDEVETEIKIQEME
ncbi:MAG: hypothetical protein HFJ48_02340 [Clostridia bacterium]|nr:hypothetical protein [Clostridia bacterium]